MSVASFQRIYTSEVSEELRLVSFYIKGDRASTILNVNKLWLGWNSLFSGIDCWESFLDVLCALRVFWVGFQGFGCMDRLENTGKY